MSALRAGWLEVLCLPGCGGVRRSAPADGTHCTHNVLEGWAISGMAEQGLVG